MVRLFFLVLVLCIGSLATRGQTCTITGTSPLNWVNPGPNCAEGGNAGTKTILIVPVGFTLNFDSNGDTWTGTRIDVYGTLNVTANPTFNCSIVVKNGGLLNLTGKLSLGTSSGCGYSLAVQTGGTANVGGTGSDRLTVCGVELMKGNGACNNCGGTNSGQCAYDGNPYCEPAGGFTGPTGYGETGYDSTLPIELSYFTVELDGDHVAVQWATEKEENFNHFEVQRAGSDLEFSSIITVPGRGYNTSSLQEYSTEDKNPLVGTGYYRLKAVDIDGSVEYFNVRSVSYQGGRNFYVSPNPTSGSSIKYTINFDPAQNDRVVLLNAIGTELATGIVTGSQNELIPNKTLSPGAYLLRYQSATFQQVTRVFIKE